MKQGNRQIEKENPLSGRLWGACLIVLLSVICFSNTFRNKFVYDDEFFVVANGSIKDLRNAPSFFTDGRTVGKGGNIEGDIYRPLTTLSYAADYSVWKLDPAGYHLTNLVFHALNAILVLFIAGFLFKDKFPALLCALFFAVHPIQTDAVTWIAGRGNVLFLFFYLLALYFFIMDQGRRDGKNTAENAQKGVKPENNKQSGNKFYIASVICFALSILSKEMAATLPLVLLLYLYYFPAQSGGKYSKQLKYTVPFFIVDILFVMARSSVLGKVSQRAYWGTGPWQTIITMANVFVDYIKLLLAPLKLCADYAYPVSVSIFEPKVLFSLAALVLVFAVLVRTRRKSGMVSFSIAWFFVTMLPVSNMIPLKILLAERFLYLPSIGFCLLLAYIIVKYIRNRHAAILCACLILAFYCSRTVLRNNDWKDGFTFWTSVIKTCPDNAKAHNNLGTYYRDAGQLEKSEAELKTAINLRPNYVTPHFNLAGLYITEKRYEESLAEMGKVLQLQPDYPGARMHYDDVDRY